MVDIAPLTELTIKLSKKSLSEEDKRFAICQCVRKVIPHVNRISLWQFENNRSAIRCLLLCEEQEITEARDIVLTEADYPEYFKAILNKEVVVASDARNHPDTQCFNDSYFQPNEIYSLLDFIFHNDFQPIGIICCESRFSKVDWDKHDESMLRRVANITSMFYST